MNLFYLNSKFLRCLLILPLVGFFLLLPARGSYVLGATYYVNKISVGTSTQRYIVVGGSNEWDVKFNTAYPTPWVAFGVLSATVTNLTTGIVYSGLSANTFGGIEGTSGVVNGSNIYGSYFPSNAFKLGDLVKIEISGSYTSSNGNTFITSISVVIKLVSVSTVNGSLYYIDIVSYSDIVSIVDATYLCKYDAAYDPYDAGSLIVRFDNVNYISNVTIDWSNTSISQDLFDVLGYFTSSTGTFYAHTKQVYPGSITWGLNVSFVDGSTRLYTFSTLPCSSGCGNLTLLSPSSGYTFSPNQNVPVVFVWDGDIKNLTSLYWKVTDSLGNQVYAENVDISKFILKDNVYQYSYTLLLSNEDKYKIAYSWHTNCDSSVGYNEVSFEVKSSFTNILDVVTAIYNTVKGVFQFLYNLIAIIVALFIVAISYLLAAIYSVAQLLRLGLSIIVGWLSALVSPLDPLTNSFPVTMPEVTFLNTKFKFDGIFYLFQYLATIRDTVPQVVWNFVLAVMLVLAIPGRPVYKEQTLFG